MLSVREKLTHLASTPSCEPLSDRKLMLCYQSVTFRDEMIPL